MTFAVHTIVGVTVGLATQSWTAALASIAPDVVLLGRHMFKRMPTTMLARRRSFAAWHVSHNAILWAAIAFACRDYTIFVGAFLHIMMDVPTHWGRWTVQPFAPLWRRRHASRCTVLLSGGPDSVATLVLACAHFGTENVLAVFVSHGQPMESKEREAAWRAAIMCDVPLRVSRMRLPPSGRFGLVPGRNMSLLREAATYDRHSELWIGNRCVAPPFDAYGDCTPCFRRRAARALRRAVRSPIIGWGKRDVYALISHSVARFSSPVSSEHLRSR